MNLHDWIDEVCDILDLDTEVDEGLILDLARVAAHQVQRTAAPVSAYLLGFAAGSTDADPVALERMAAQIQRLADSWDRPSSAREPDDVDVVVDEADVDFSADLEDDRAG